MDRNGRQSQIYKKRPEKVTIVQISDEERHMSMLGKIQRMLCWNSSVVVVGRSTSFPI